MIKEKSFRGLTVKDWFKNFVSWNACRDKKVTGIVHDDIANKEFWGDDYKDLVEVEIIIREVKK